MSGCISDVRGLPSGSCRPSPPRLPDLSTQVARLFFDRQLSKVEIASRLGISRFRVARLIEGALADGLVRIEYRDVPAEDRELAGAMEERFGLDLCAVAVEGVAEHVGRPFDDGCPAPRRRRPGRPDRPTATRSASPGDPRWPPSCVRSLPAVTADSEVVQLAGSSSRLDRDRDAGELARVLADRLGGIAHPIFAPTFVETTALRAALLREPELAEHGRPVRLPGPGDRRDRRDARQTPAGRASSLVRSGVLDDDEIRSLAERGAVGDLVVHPFDAEGRSWRRRWPDRAIAIGVDQLAARAASWRSRPVSARRGRSGARWRLAIVRILVTDAPTARAVLEIG